LEIASSQRTVIIAEPHLEHTAGHPLRYVKALTAAFLSNGARVIIMGGRRFPLNTVAGTPVDKVFDHPIYRQWNDPAEWLVKLRSRRHRFKSQIVNLYQIFQSLIGALERPPGWSFLWSKARPLNARLRIARRLRLLLKAIVMAAVAILLSPFYLIVGTIAVLMGGTANRSTLSPFARKVLQAVEKAERNGPVSIVVPTATAGILSELLALPVIHPGPFPSLYLIFHDDPNLWGHWYRPTTLDGVAGRLKASGWSRRVHFYATTDTTAARIRHMYGADTYVRAIEDIFTPDDLDQMKVSAAATPGGSDANAEEAALLDWVNDQRTEGLRLAFIPGPLRLDKGAFELPHLVSALDSAAGKKFALLVQKAGPDWLSSMFRRASTHPRVHVADFHLSDGLVHRLLSEADILLLPYVSSDYAARISSNMNEALLHAKPVLVSDGTGMQKSVAKLNWVRSLSKWNDWPHHALDVLGTYDRAAAKTHAGELETRLRHNPAWDTLVQDVLRPSIPLHPKAPVILVRPPWPKSGSARLQDEQLSYFASEERPILEIIVERSAAPRHRSWSYRAILEDRASSPSGIVCFVTPRSGLIAGLSFFARHGLKFLKSTYTGQLAEMSQRCQLPAIALQIARKRQASFVLVHHYERMPFVAPLAKFLPIWLETQDIQAILHVQHNSMNMVRLRTDPFPTMLKEEMAWVRKADAVVAISETELSTFQKHVDSSKVFLCQPPISITKAEELEEIRPPIDILYVASDNPGNLASIKWFISEVWPDAYAAGLRCFVVGNIDHRMRSEGLETKGIEIVGAVDSLAPWYAAARVVAIPTVEGTGIGIKTIEALAAGVPIVATSLAYRGFPSDWDRPTQPLDTGASFAAELMRLCRSEPARKATAERVRHAYQTLDLKNRYLRQMRAIEDHVLKAGERRTGRKLDA
jgi:glycosyltransferase involved in cell wall biosynthesis